MGTLIKSKLKAGFISRVILFVWLISFGLVCYLSLKPSIEFPVDFEGADLLYHALSYLWLGFLASFIFQTKRQYIASLFFLILLGISLEFGQLFVPGRNFSIMDMIANGSGTIFGLGCGLQLRSRFFKIVSFF